MDTQTLNNTPNHRDSDKKSEKVKKVAGESAKFAAAAGLGVVGTMAANAMNNPEDPADETQSTSESQPIQEEVAVEEIVETVNDFNPNDIMIEDVEDEIVSEESVHNPISSVNEDKQEFVAAEEIQPITGENIDVVIGDNGTDIAIVDVDDPTIGDVIIDGEPMFNPDDDLLEPDWGAINGESGEILASEDLSEPDILGDILA